MGNIRIVLLMLACAGAGLAGSVESAPALALADPSSNAAAPEEDASDLSSILPETVSNDLTTIAAGDVLAAEDAPIVDQGSADGAGSSGLLGLYSAGFSVADIVGYELSNPWVLAAALLGCGVLVTVIALYRSIRTNS